MTRNEAVYFAVAFTLAFTSVMGLTEFAARAIGMAMVFGSIPGMMFRDWLVKKVRDFHRLAHDDGWQEARDKAVVDVMTR